jgi:hypothetical protein
MLIYLVLYVYKYIEMENVEKSHKKRNSRENSFEKILIFFYLRLIVAVGTKVAS